MKKTIRVIRAVLQQCHKKIRLYNEANQEYIGGVEATRLLQNIEDVLNNLGAIK